MGISLQMPARFSEFDPYKRIRGEPEEDPEEDPIDYAANADDDEDKEEESSEDDDDEEDEHLAPAYSIVVASAAVDPVPSAEETDAFRTFTTIFTHSIIITTSPNSLLPLPVPSPPTTSPTYTEAPLGYRAVGIRLRVASPLPSPTSPPTHHPLSLHAPSTSRRADIPEADIPPRKRLLLTAPIPRFEVRESSDVAATRQPGSTMTRRVDYSFVNTMYASIRASERRTMAAIEVVNLRRDHAALRDEVDTLRRYLSFLCTTHEQERVEARQDLDRSEAHNKALEARIVVLETQAYRQKWQR
ncbi:hypothetical protein Tco_1396436 [Tanacetum coccineum]